MRRLTHTHMRGRAIPKMRLYGCGMGSVILNKGGAGVGSSYESPEAYEQITGQKIGKGLGAGLTEKLSKLMVKPLASKKPNIAFNL